MVVLQAVVTTHPFNQPYPLQPSLPRNYPRGYLESYPKGCLESFLLDQNHHPPLLAPLPPSSLPPTPQPQTIIMDVVITNIHIIIIIITHILRRMKVNCMDCRCWWPRRCVDIPLRAIHIYPHLLPSTPIYYHPHLPLPPCHNVANLTTLFSLLSMYLFFSLSYPSLSCSFYSYPLFLSLFFSFCQVRRQSIKGISVDDLLATVYPAGFADAAGGGADTHRTTDSDEDNEDNDDPSTSYHRSPSGAQGHGGKAGGGKGGEKGGRGGSTRKLSYSPALHGQGKSTSNIHFSFTTPSNTPSNTPSTTPSHPPSDTPFQSTL